MRPAETIRLLAALGVLALPWACCAEATPGFAAKPTATRDGDRVTVAFETTGPCDVTVAVEDAEGRIVRHLACGVLGPNAPEPLAKNSTKQTLLWDGKDDAGQYVDDKDALAVRVSLGLTPRFEKNLFFEPKKRFGTGTILLKADREGVYVYDACGCETIRLYDHRGEYARTIYPFPADKVAEVKGLPWLTFPDGGRAPAKRGYFLSTLLAGRESGGVESTIVNTSEATGMAVGGGRVALTGLRLNRLATDGGSGGLPLYGPFVDVPPREYRVPKTPTSLAFSPDGEYLYLTGYVWLHPRGWAPVSDARWRHGLWRMKYASNDPPQLFLGQDDTAGDDDAHFNQPADVVVDPAGRLYVADNLNDRVQVFSADGKLLQSLKVESPVRLALHSKTGQLYVFSWFIARTYSNRIPQSRQVAPRLRVFDAFPRLKLERTLPLPLRDYRTSPAWSQLVGGQYQVAVDSWTDPPTIWLVAARGGYPILLREANGELAPVRDFRDDALRSGVRLTPPKFNRQRLYVDPVRGHLYLAEGDVGTGKAFSNIVRIDPDTGREVEVQLPFSASDMVFAPDGLCYLRTGMVVGRFDPTTWREVPFDYGEQVTAAYSYDARSRKLAGGLLLPSTKTNPSWHHGGMDVNCHGDLVVTCFNPASRQIPTREEQRRDDVREKGAPFTPIQYPGRWASGHEMHVWDRYGRIKYADILRGHPRDVGGVFIDDRGDIYANISISVMADGEPYYKRVGHRFDQVGTLVKFSPEAGRFLMAAGGQTPVRLADPPRRPQDLNGVWIEGAKWIYPGVGRSQWGMDCSCWNSRFALDRFARSFAPEHDRYSVAVLDAAGNRILRIGRYGNVDSAGPASLVPVGGDEVTLFDAAYVATETDRRVYIADAGNARIVSVKLGYAAEERVRLGK